MKSWFLLFISLISGVVILSSCSNKSTTKRGTDTNSSNNIGQLYNHLKNVTTDQIHDLKSLENPTVNNITIGKAYITSIKKIKYNGNLALWVKGNLPDGCSKLYRVVPDIDDSTLSLELVTWRPKNAKCTQALVPFSYIFSGLSLFEFKSVNKYKINNQIKSF